MQTRQLEGVKNRMGPGQRLAVVSAPRRLLKFTSLPMALALACVLLAPASLSVVMAQATPQTPPVSQPLSSTASQEQQDQDPIDRLIEMKCPGVLERQQQRDQARLLAAVGPPSRPALRHQLLIMRQRDQEARSAALETMASAATPGFESVSAIDVENQRQLKHIIVQDGFPTRSMVGDDGVVAAWLLTQHSDSDPDFQARVLRTLFVRVRQHEFPAKEYAMLVDRVLIHDGKPQRYGTQFGDDGSGLKVGKMEDPAHADQRRGLVGMGPIADYACAIHAIYAPSAPEVR